MPSDPNRSGGEAYDMKAARAIFAPKIDPRKKARKERQRQAVNAVDRRSLRATGRTEHLNFKAHPDIIAALNAHVGKGNKSLWLEKAIKAQLRAEGFDIDA
jgi:hypothetical protein